MTEEQNKHRNRIQNNFIKDHTAKFELGAKEHKTLLHEDYSAPQILDMALEEVIDLVSYLYTLKESLQSSLDYCQQQNGIPVCKNCGLGE